MKRFEIDGVKVFSAESDKDKSFSINPNSKWKVIETGGAEDPSMEMDASEYGLTEAEAKKLATKWNKKRSKGDIEIYKVKFTAVPQYENKKFSAESDKDALEAWKKRYNEASSKEVKDHAALWIRHYGGKVPSDKKDKKFSDSEGVVLTFWSDLDDNYEGELTKFGPNERFKSSDEIRKGYKDRYEAARKKLNDKNKLLQEFGRTPQFRVYDTEKDAHKWMTENEIKG